MTRALQRSMLLAVAALLVPSGGIADGASGTPFFDKLVQSRLVHCAFYKSYDVDQATGDLVMMEGRSDSLTHFQGMRDGRARQITTRMAGAREVVMSRSGKYLHFIDEVAGMYMLTTIYDCIDRDKGGVCLSYGAMQSRHFDKRVLYDPDTVFEALRNNSDPGFCDHSFVNIREASK